MSYIQFHLKLFDSFLNVAASAALLLLPVAAKAAPTTCWIQFPNDTGDVSAQRCDLRYSKNAQGLNVQHLTTINDGATAHIVLWFDPPNSPSYAEVKLPVDGTYKTYIFQFSYDESGDVYLLHKQSGMAMWYTPLSTSSPAATPAFTGI